MIQIIALILLGFCAIPSLVIAKKPDAQALYDKFAPLQGWFGAVFFIYGIYGVIQMLLSIGLIANAPVVWTIVFITVFLEAALGFILGFNLINQYILSKNAKSEEKGKALLAKLLPLQGKLGIAAIALGCVFLVLYLIS